MIVGTSWSARNFCNSSRFAVSTEIFGRIKTEAAKLAQAADTAVFIFCADGLGTIFDHRNIARLRQFKNFLERRGLAEEMHGNNRFRARGNFPANISGIEVE